MMDRITKQNDEIISKKKKVKRWHKIVGVLACVVVFISTYALVLPAITEEKPTYCGHEEHIEHSVEAGCYAQTVSLICNQAEGGHTHGDACYQIESKLTCGLAESEGHTHVDACFDENGDVICGISESAGHLHSNSCYAEEKVLICDIPESGTHEHTAACYKKEENLVCQKELHTHTEECLIDKKADVETQADWEKTLESVKLTGEWAADVIAIAESQLGYAESTQNYTIAGDDNKHKGYTRYGAWYGDPYGDWCAMFVSFCLEYAHVDSQYMPREANCQRWIQMLSKESWNMYAQAADYEPVVGDLVFFDWDTVEEGVVRVSDHVGLVAEIIRDEQDVITGIKTIEGNSSDKVQYKEYEIDNSTILGYGKLPKNPATDLKSEPSDEVVEVDAAVLEQEQQLFDQMSTGESELAQAAMFRLLSEDDMGYYGEPEDYEEPEYYPWGFDVYYIGQGEERKHVEKTNDFNLKYQMVFTTDQDLEKDAVKIRIPAALMIDRYGDEILPADIAVPRGTPESPVYSKVTAFNYYYETDEDGTKYLVFFNYLPIRAGSNNIWQVYYKNINLTEIVDESTWSLTPEARVDLMMIDWGEGEWIEGEPEPMPEITHVEQSQEVIPLTGHINTTATLNSVQKEPYHVQNSSYTPALYTTRQVKAYAPELQESEIDLENYVYVVWRVTANMGYNQAWELYLQDDSYVLAEDEENVLLDDNQNPVRGEVVSVRSNRSTVSKVPANHAYADAYDYQAATYNSNGITRNSNDSRYYYVVTKYPREYVHSGTVLRNDVSFLLHPVDEIDEDTVKSDFAEFTYIDYVWRYRGDIIDVDKYTDTPTNHAWSEMYYYKSDAFQGEDQGEDYGNQQFHVNGVMNGYLLTNQITKTGDDFSFVPTDKSYIPNTWAECTTTDDYLFAWVSGRSADTVEMKETKELTKDDYYYSQVRIVQTDKARDFFEDEFVEATSDQMIQEAGGNPVDRSMKVYAMFALDEDGNEVDTYGYADEDWEYVDTVSWDDKGVLKYTFPESLIEREPYRVKVVHNTVDRTVCDIYLTVTIKHDSPVFNAWYSLDHKITVQFENLCGILGNFTDANGEKHWVHDQSTANNYFEEKQVPLIDFTKNLYGMIIQRDAEQNTLLPIDSEATAKKSAMLHNDPINGQYNITYSLTAMESYLVQNSYTASVLEKYMETVPSNRKSVEFYDLLPKDVQFDPTVEVTASRMMDYKDPLSAGGSNTDIEVETKEIIQNWRDTGRTMVVFSVRYNGMDPSVVSEKHWLTGYTVRFGAYCLWEDVDLALEEANIAAYMPAPDDPYDLIGKTSQISKDDGVIIPESLDRYCTPFHGGDINGDGVTDRRNVLYMERAAADDFAMASNDNIQKLVKADNDVIGAFGDYAIVQPGGDYTYRVFLKNLDTSPLTNLIIFDKLENAAKDRIYEEPLMGFPTDPEQVWTGTYTGIDLSAAIKMGIAPVVYYNANRDVEIKEDHLNRYHDLTQENGWYTEDDWIQAGMPLADVKAIAVDFTYKTDGSKFVLASDSRSAETNLSFDIHMQAPDTEPEYVYTFNNPSYSSTKNEGKNNQSDTTIIGDSVQVSLKEESSFSLVKRIEGAPEEHMDDEFTFEIRDGAGNLYTYQIYHLYNWINNQWVEQKSKKYSTDVNGQLTIKANQRVLFNQQAGANELTAIEVNNNPLWKSEVEIQEGQNTTCTVTNIWQPLLYFQKHLDGLNRYETESSFGDTPFYFKIQYKDAEGNWINASGIEYGTVDRIVTNSYSIPKYKPVGNADENGIVTVYPNKQYATQIGQTGTEYRLVEVAYEPYEDEYQMVEPVDGKLVSYNWWETHEPEKTGVLGNYGNKEIITNYSQQKSIYLKKVVLNAPDENTEYSFKFQLRDQDGNPVANQLIYYKPLDTSYGYRYDYEAYTDENGYFTLSQMYMAEILVRSGTEYQIVEIQESSDFELVKVVCDSPSSNIEDGVSLKLDLYDTDSTVTFTNNCLLRDLKVEKQVLDMNGNFSGKEFAMRVEKKNPESGEWEPVPNAEYTKSNKFSQSDYSYGSYSMYTEENGEFWIANNDVVTFKAIGIVGEEFRIIETLDPEYPQIYPQTEIVDGVQEGAPLELTLGPAGAQGTIINGAPGMVIVDKQWNTSGVDINELSNNYQLEYLAPDLGVTLNIQVKREGDTEFRDISWPEDQMMGYVLKYYSWSSTPQINYLNLKSSVLHYDDPLNSMLILMDYSPDWLNSTYRIQEIGMEGEVVDEGSLTYMKYNPALGMLLQSSGNITAAEGFVSSDSTAYLENSMEATPLTWIYKRLWGDYEPEPGAELVWRVERFNGQEWVPASGIEYVVTKDSVPESGYFDSQFFEVGLKDNTIFKTDENGLMRISYEKEEEEEDEWSYKPDYTYAIGFLQDVKVNITPDMNAYMKPGDLRVVEVAELTDPSWGVLQNYGYHSGKYAFTKYPSENADIMVNTLDTKVIRIEKQMVNGETGVGPFSFAIRSCVDNKEILSEAQIPYEVYDAATDTYIETRVTTPDGYLELLSGQYALLEVSKMTQWYIEENAGYPYELVQVDIDGTVNQTDHGVFIDVPSATLETGKTINSIIKKCMDDDGYSYQRQIVIGYKGEYTDRIQGFEGIEVQVPGSNPIELYDVNGQIFILSDYQILFNEDSSEMFKDIPNAYMTITNGTFKNVTNMSGMFHNGPSTSNESNNEIWKTTGSVTDMSYMFAGSGSQSVNIPANLDTSSVTNMSHMFEGRKDLSYTSSNLRNWDVSSVEDMSYMFSNMKDLGGSLEITEWNVSNVKNMSHMFSNSQLPRHLLDLANWNVSNVTDMSYMFANTTSYSSYYTAKLNLANWHTSNVTDMSHMFENCKAAEIQVVGFDTSNVTDMAYMFSGCSSITSLAVSDFDTSNVTDMANMFNQCSKLTSLDVSGFDTSNVTDMSYMFAACSKLTRLDVSGFDTSKVTNMARMFASVIASTYDVSGFDTSNVIDLSGMFYYNTKLTSLDLSSWSVREDADVSYMFYNCSALVTIYADEWPVVNVPDDSPTMFRYCSKLVGKPNGKSYSSSNYSKAMATPNGGYFSIKSN